MAYDGPPLPPLFLYAEDLRDKNMVTIETNDGRLFVVEAELPW